MKRLFGMMILTLAIVGCQKAPTETRIGSGGLTPEQATAQTGIQRNGIVVVNSSYQSQFQDGVGDIMELMLPRQYVGYVSSQGGDTGVFVGGRIELSNGQPLRPGQYVNTQVTANSQLLIGVVDKFADQTSLAPLPALIFSQVTQSYVSGNSVKIVFYNPGDVNKNGAGRGTITLTGTFDQSRATLQFDYDIERTYNGSAGYQGTLGTLYVPTCQFFRCQ